MNPNKALWEKGDFTQIAAFMRQSGEEVVKSLGITPPLRVLDLGCGDGTTAIPLAQSGADVVGIDIAKNLVEAGKKRSAGAGLNRLTFQEGDACDLQGVGDRSSTVVSFSARHNALVIKPCAACGASSAGLNFPGAPRIKSQPGPVTPKI